MLDRFYCPEPPEGGRLRLTGDEARHLALVLRKRPGEVVEVFDGLGNAWRAEILAISKGLAELDVVGDPLPDRVAPCRLTLATAVPKGERFDWLVEKATELGVNRLVPLRTTRSVVDPGGAKLGRLRRAVVEASKQCGRNRLMELGEPADLGDYLRNEPATARLLADPGGVRAGWGRAIGAGERVALAIGPEGGFTAEEVEAARGAGWEPIGLGRTVLRIETAGLAGCAAIFNKAEEGPR